MTNVLENEPLQAHLKLPKRYEEEDQLNHDIDSLAVMSILYKGNNYLSLSRIAYHMKLERLCQLFDRMENYRKFIELDWKKEGFRKKWVLQFF